MKSCDKELLLARIGSYIQTHCQQVPKGICPLRGGPANHHRANFWMPLSKEVPEDICYKVSILPPHYLVKLQAYIPITRWHFKARDAPNQGPFWHCYSFLFSRNLSPSFPLYLTKNFQNGLGNVPAVNSPFHEQTWGFCFSWTSLTKYSLNDKQEEMEIPESVCQF